MFENMKKPYNGIRIRVMVRIATFNNSSVISGRSVLLVEETGVSGQNHGLVASHWQTLSHNVASSTYRLSGNHNVSGDRHWLPYNGRTKNKSKRQTMTYKTKDGEQHKIRDELRCSGSVISSCFTSCTRRVTVERDEHHRTC